MPALLTGYGQRPPAWPAPAAPAAAAPPAEGLGPPLSRPATERPPAARPLFLALTARLPPPRLLAQGRPLATQSSAHPQRGSVPQGGRRPSLARRSLRCRRLGPGRETARSGARPRGAQGPVHRHSKLGWQPSQHSRRCRLRRTAGVEPTPRPAPAALSLLLQPLSRSPRRPGGQPNPPMPCPSTCVLRRPRHRRAGWSAPSPLAAPLAVAPRSP
mmetsp:Transcript_3205/g.13149  ORF Transcript_3205/g.13149 Transcript_3205/m.13149 type:complete len:215 (-) Transcript_3205:2267-2911(-)